MLGLNHWKSRLDEIYNAVAKELETMYKILETYNTPLIYTNQNITTTNHD